MQHDKGGNDVQRAMTMPAATLEDRLFPWLTLIRTPKGSAKDGVIKVKRKPVLSLSLLPMVIECTGKICLRWLVARRVFKGKGEGEREIYRSRVALSSFDILICTYMWVNWRAVRSCNKPAHDLNAHYLLKDQAIIKLDQVYWNEAKRRLMTGALRA